MSKPVPVLFYFTTGDTLDKPRPVALPPFHTTPLLVRATSHRDALRRVAAHLWARGGLGEARKVARMSAHTVPSVLSPPAPSPRGDRFPGTNRARILEPMGDHLWTKRTGHDRRAARRALGIGIPEYPPSAKRDGPSSRWEVGADPIPCGGEE